MCFPNLPLFKLYWLGRRGPCVGYDTSLRPYSEGGQWGKWRIAGRCTNVHISGCGQLGSVCVRVKGKSASVWPTRSRSHNKARLEQHQPPEPGDAPQPTELFRISPLSPITTWSSGVLSCSSVQLLPYAAWGPHIRAPTHRNRPLAIGTDPVLVFSDELKTLFF